MIQKFLFGLFLLTYTLSGFVQDKQVPLPASKNKLVVIAHRGDHTKVPENTLAAFKNAIKSGADYVEVDVRASKDGYLVVHHDATVNRMTNGTGKVSELTWQELKNLKVTDKAKGSKKAYSIPLFSEVLALCKDKINIYLDFKDADAAKAVREIKDAGMEQQVAVYINSIPQYREWRRQAPAIPLIISAIEEVKNKDQLAFFLNQGTIEVLDNIYDKEMVATANEYGVSVWLDVQHKGENADDWKKAIELGVQGLQTDNPKALVTYLKKNNLRDGITLQAADPYAKYKKQTYRELKNIKYGSAPDGQNVFDAYIPQNLKEGAKVIVYIHGGGWTKGDKSEFPKQLIEELAGKRGYVVASVNYRLVKNGENRFPAQIEDIKKVIEFITKNAKRYRYNADDIVLMGGSAGGHLSMLYAYGHDAAKQVKAVVNLWGPTDLTDKAVREDGTDADNTVINFLGEKDPNADITKQASPIYFLTKETGAPTVLFHGGKDPLVHVSQAEKLYKKLQELGIPAHLEIYPEEKHGVGPASAVDVFKKAIEWIEKYNPNN
ncbi:MAG: alpha/beta hydrolase fold domain-containing protein [Chitinophagaceae bacterium]|nr:alpha/beta hydrolase fold domain-containing protein [Chitinophagaceae bacterium]MCW5925458.1 alpha/beta hydrolase fold domain-containing protein [Chitinophagaceae bacterium]